ncbi:MAG: sugar transferase [Oscillospiraceae bacterium]|nr:sugar transferase [Oscillospiraceae bacterium]
MLIADWKNLPETMKNDEVLVYYNILKKKKTSLFFKRLLDVSVSLIGIILLSPVFLILFIAIKTTSKGPVFFRQERIGRYGKSFRIYKFRTMVDRADKMGAQVTTGDDVRITKVGKFLRKTKLDEIPQMIDILLGHMSYVGTRPEVPKFVGKYTKEMYATLLTRPGLTSVASIKYTDENEILSGSENPEEDYVNLILPDKMKYNLEYFKDFSFWFDIKVVFETFLRVIH